jgi:arginine decarboxylase
VRKLHEKGSIDKDMYIVCNGFKRPLYKQYISEIINEGFTNCIPVLDTLNEIDYYLEHIEKPIQVGIRVAADEEPNFEFYTSRLGVRYGDVNR